MLFLVQAYSRRYQEGRFTRRESTVQTVLAAEPRHRYTPQAYQTLEWKYYCYDSSYDYFWSNNYKTVYGVHRPISFKKLI